MKQYKTLSNGVVEQLDKKLIVYDNNYAETRYKNFNNSLSYLRLGFLCGVLGKVPTSILDVGFGLGGFLNVCKHANIKSSGYDIVPRDTPEGVDKVIDLFSSYHQVVSFFDSLEHFSNISFVKDLKCKYIIISVPSCNFPDDEAWFMNWKHRREDEHVFHFNSASLINFMYEEGFIPLKVCEGLEDVIRKDERYSPNIVTGVFQKI